MLLVLLLCLQFSYCAVVPCTNTHPAGCLIVNINSTSGWATTCPCQTCQTGLVRAYDGRTCCSANVAECQTCSSSSTCIRCRSSFGFNSTSICVQCRLFITNCLYCLNIAAGCTTCRDEFSLNLTGNICVPCTNYMPYCKYCFSSRTSCSSCNSTIYAVNASLSPNRCQLCNITLKDCSTCNTVNYCTSCFSDRFALYWYSSSNQ